MDAVFQFKELSSKHYEILKSFPEFSEAESIYEEIIKLRLRLKELENLRNEDILKITDEF